jgi:predicted phosphodiesterase
MTFRGPPSDRRTFLHAAAGFAGLAWSGRRAPGDESPADAELRFGVIADCQYADVPTAGTRYYRQSLEKLRHCVKTLNDNDVRFVVHLGDFIDRGMENLEKVVPVLKQCQAPTYHVLGNHDFSVADERKAEVPRLLGMPSRYYDFSFGRWRFVVLDGNDISLVSRREGTEPYRRAEAMLAGLKSRGAPHAHNWNGAVSDSQLAWLKQTLVAAAGAGQRVIVFCHFPVYPPNAHNLWNDQQLLEIFASHPGVVAYLNGHNHAGNYARKNGVHFLTVEGMVETADTTAFAIAHASVDSLRIQGFGRVADRTLPLC